MKNPELARLFYQEILKNHPDTPPSSEHIQKLYQLLVALFLKVTEQEKIQFTTLFSRIAFAFQKHKCGGGGEKEIQQKYISFFLNIQFLSINSEGNRKNWVTHPTHF